MREINNYNYYLTEMQKSLYDKAFFIDKIYEPIKNVVDYGCADGSLILLLQRIAPEYNYFGYDISPEMVERARNRNVSAYNDFNLMMDAIAAQTCCGFSDNETLLNLSSVIHEVYSYCSKEEIDEFWSRVFKSGFKYICFRDMMVSEFNSFRNTFSIPSFSVFPTDKVEEYKKEWGSIDASDASQIHFLLKAQFFNSENWNREVQENYLPITVEKFLRIIPEEYEIVYKNHYTLPYFKYWCKKNANTDVNIPTHFQLILKRRI